MNKGTKIQKDAYNRLARLMRDEGESFQKKHGNWIRMNLYRDLWLVMDSWNKSIRVVKGDCNYDSMYTGFKYNKTVQYLGIDFGGFEIHVPSSTLDYYHDKAKYNEL